MIAAAVTDRDLKVSANRRSVRLARSHVIGSWRHRSGRSVRWAWPI